MKKAQSLEDSLPEELSRWRRWRGLTAQELSDRITEHGGALSRQAISKIENGDRKVTLDEVSALAHALGVPPVLLIVPLGREESIRVLPDLVAPAWDVIKWWSGRIHRLEPGVYVESVEDFLTLGTIGFFNAHDELLHEIHQARRASIDVERDTAVPRERLRDLRTNMRRAGLLPPELPDDLSHIDERAG